MRITQALFVSGVLAVCGGCTVAYNAARTLVVEPAHFPNYLEKCQMQARTGKLAEDAWKEVALDGQPYSEHHATGFKCGFADYLQFGGPGEPPPVPPRSYWDAASLSGREAAQEWFTGFRHGAAAAKKSGYRELIIVPASSIGLLTPARPERGLATWDEPEWTGPPHPQTVNPPMPSTLQPDRPKP